MKKTVLLILDGWGKGRGDETDGIHLAHTPFMDSLYESYPNSTLVTYGEAVGLPEGQMGNSEVGHLNIGAGRVVYQDLVKINNAIKDKSFFENETLLNAIKAAKAGNKKVHLMGLVSKGGVHSSQEHLYALCDLLAQNDVMNSYIHAFTDGRDCDPKSGLGYISELENHLEGSNTKIASVIGRYYAMDRDKRWERIKKAYDLLTKGKGSKFSSASEAIESSYSKDITDEFIEPSVIENVQIEAGDVVICFNFRTDRCREITMALTQHNYPDQDLAVRIQVFTVSGIIVKTMDGYYNSKGFRIGPISWDGRDDFGDKIGRGVYVYKVEVKSPNGDAADKFEKLVILN